MPPAEVALVDSSSSVSGTRTTVDEDDNDLTDNQVPQVQAVQQAQAVQHQTVTQVVSPPATVVQKIKVRPRPAVCILCNLCDFIFINHL